MEIKDGIYNGKVVDYGMKNTQEGKPQAFIVFELVSEDEPKPEWNGIHLTWYGSFSTEKSTEFVVKVLIDCGFSAGAVSMLAAGINGNSIPLNTPMVLDVFNDSYKGETKTKIRYVNKPGSGPAMERLSHEEAVSVLGVAEAIFQREKQKAPAPVVKVATPTHQPTTTEKKKFF